MKVTIAAWTGLFLATAACGDNVYLTGESLPQAPWLNVVAHPDDDLLFMQPDLWATLHRAVAAVTVFVTAGEGSRGLDFSIDRQRGILWAYAAVSGATSWSCGAVTIERHLAEHCVAVGGRGPVSVVFLNLPDGGTRGNAAGSLKRLWEGRVTTVATVSGQSSDYTQPQLIAVLADIVKQVAPKTVRTLDVVATHGPDHSDHTMVGALTTLAVAAAKSPAVIVSFRGYNIGDEPDNKPALMFDSVSVMMKHYNACATGCGACGAKACDAISEFHEGLLRRRFATSVRRRNIQGRLQTEAGCLHVSGSQLVVVDCDTALDWLLADDQLRIGDHCVSADSGGQLSLAACDRTPSQWWRLSDEGILVGGMLSPTLDDMQTRHTMCMHSVGTMVSGVACGEQIFTSWRLLPSPETRPMHIGAYSTQSPDVDHDAVLDDCSNSDGKLFCALNGNLPWRGIAVPWSYVDNGVVDALLPAAGASVLWTDLDGDDVQDACVVEENNFRCSFGSMFGLGPTFLWPAHGVDSDVL